jgi:hypothetical protein
MNTEMEINQEQMMAKKKGEMKTNQEMMEAKASANLRQMNAEVRANNEILEVLEVFSSPGWVSTKPGQNLLKKK